MSTISAVIKQASAADAATLARLGRDTGKAYFSDICSTSELEEFLERDFSATTLETHLNNPGKYSYMLLELESQPVGFVRINWNSHVPLSDAAGAELQKIYLLPGYTGQGLGTRLLNDAIERVSERREALIWLDVLSNNRRARRLYEHHGFTVTGKLPFRTSRVDISRHVMIRQKAPAK